MNEGWRERNVCCAENAGDSSITVVDSTTVALQASPLTCSRTYIHAPCFSALPFPAGWHRTRCIATEKLPFSTIRRDPEPKRERDAVPGDPRQKIRGADTMLGSRRRRSRQGLFTWVAISIWQHRTSARSVHPRQTAGGGSSLWERHK